MCLSTPEVVHSVGMKLNRLGEICDGPLNLELTHFNVATIAVRLRNVTITGDSVWVNFFSYLEILNGAVEIAIHAQGDTALNVCISQRGVQLDGACVGCYCTV